MLFGKIIEKHKATSIITYKLISYGDISFSIWKYNEQHDTKTYICRNIKSRDAVMLIWADVVAGLQK